MSTRWWKRLAAAAALQAVLLATALKAQAQDAPPDAPPPPPPALGAPAASPAPSDPAAPPPANITISRDELRKLIDEAIKEHDQKRVPAIPVNRSPLAEDPAVLQDPAAPKASDDLSKVVNDIISDREKLKAAADARKKEEDREKGYVVGENLTMTAKWRHGVWIESVDKAFQFHLGGRIQLDSVF